MEKLKLEKIDRNGKMYSRKTAKKVLENVIQRIIEVNAKKEFIYRIEKAVVFGSYINSKKEKIGDLDVAIYLELKDKSKEEMEQNFVRASISLNYVPFIFRFIYGKEEIFRYIKDKKRVLELHDGVKVDEEAKKNNDSISYIYIDKNQVIYDDRWDSKCYNLY